MHADAWDKSHSNWFYSSCLLLLHMTKKSVFLIILKYWGPNRWSTGVMQNELGVLCMLFFWFQFLNLNLIIGSGLLCCGSFSGEAKVPTITSKWYVYVTCYQNCIYCRDTLYREDKQQQGEPNRAQVEAFVCWQKEVSKLWMMTIPLYKKDLRHSLCRDRVDGERSINFNMGNDGKVESMYSMSTREAVLWVMPWQVDSSNLMMKHDANLRS